MLVRTVDIFRVNDHGVDVHLLTLSQHTNYTVVFAHHWRVDSSRMFAVCDASVFTKQAGTAGGDPSAVFGTYSDYRLLHGANDSRSSHRLFHSVAVGIF